MRNGILTYFSVLTAFICCLPLFSQTDSTTVKKPKYYILETDTIPTLLLKPDSVQTKKKKGPKKKKKVFYGLKCKKAFIRTMNGQNQIIETFYVLKEWKDPNSYLPDVYVWDITKNKIVKVSKIDADKKAQYRVLHGPYTKEINGMLVEYGAYYIGAKHARWELYNKEVVVAKTKYYKGWPKEAKISYYDAEQKKIKEVIPYEYGELQGDYYYFSEKGNIQTKGRYENGVKVGLWIDYFPNTTTRQRETQYTEDPYDTTTQPVIVKEWNDKGKIIILDGKAVVPGSVQEQNEDPIKKRLKRK